MNWWFANQGIVVDTAGKMLMKEVGSGESSLWKELLAMLKRVRPQQPINGMILCISVDSLIRTRPTRSNRRRERLRGSST